MLKREIRTPFRLTSHEEHTGWESANWILRSHFIPNSEFKYRITQTVRVTGCRFAVNICDGYRNESTVVSSPNSANWSMVLAYHLIDECSARNLINSEWASKKLCIYLKLTEKGWNSEIFIIFSLCSSKTRFGCPNYTTCNCYSQPINHMVIAWVSEK